MKPFKTKTIGSFLLAASSLFLISSCTKSLDEQAKKSENNPNVLELGGRCGRSIQFHIDGSHGCFFYQDPINELQDFSTNDFTTDKRYVEVTATTNGANGVTTVAPFFANTGTEGFGVISNVDAGQQVGRINVGETLVWKLGTDFPGFAWYGFALNMQASKDCNGTVQLYRNNILSATVPFTGVGKNAKNFGLTYFIDADKYFTEMRFTVTSGSVRINGQLNAANPLNQPNGELFVIDLPNVAFMSFNNAEPFINATIAGVTQPFVDRQRRDVLIPEGAANSGVFDKGNKQYLNFGVSSSLVGGGTLVYSGNRFAVRSSLEGSPATLSLNNGEMITVTAGPDLPFKFFRTLELREAHLTGTTTGGKMIVRFYKDNGTTLVDTKLTSGVDAGYDLYDAPEDFDTFTISGPANGANRASLGRPGIAIKLSKGCGTQ